MPFNFSQTCPTALLVGASRGLGAAMAEEFAKRDWNVVGTVRGGKRTPLHDLADRYDGQIAIETLDIIQREQVATLHERLAGHAFEMLFVNAGVADRNPDAHMDEISAEDFNRVMLTNAMGVMLAVEVWRDNQDESSATIRMRPASRGVGMIDAARHSHKG